VVELNLADYSVSDGAQRMAE
jgi:hypothetical protein